ncbi:MAG: epoxyqueuosine reductase [Paracoccaceae bacterium]|jgi:epoxyqueuosine reductase
MARPNPHRPFIPDPAQVAVTPETSGNTVNGLGDPEQRRPNMVYWAPDPDDIAHGAMQQFFYAQSAKVPEFAVKRAERIALFETPLSPIADQAAHMSPDDWTAGLDRFVLDETCERIGVTEMNADWVYEGREVTQSRIIIIIGVQHDYDEIRTAPEPQAGLEVVSQYIRAGVAAKHVAGWIRQQGWDAEPVTGPMTGALTMIPPALACGFGELGKHGSLINPEFGSSFRLAAVLTDAPFASTPARDFGIDEFCQSCRICEDACPPEALYSQKQTVRGVEKWYVNFDKCLPYFNQNHGCAICIAVCPWSRPGVGVNLATKLARRSERQATG